VEVILDNEFTHICTTSLPHARTDACTHIHTHNLDVSLVQYATVSCMASTLLGLFVCLLLHSTSALFRPLVPRIVEVEHTSHVKNDLK